MSRFQLQKTWADFILDDVKWRKNKSWKSHTTKCLVSVLGPAQSVSSSSPKPPALPSKNSSKQSPYKPAPPLPQQPKTSPSQQSRQLPKPPQSLLNQADNSCEEAVAAPRLPQKVNGIRKLPLAPPPQQPPSDTSSLHMMTRPLSTQDSYRCRRTSDPC